jgi:heterodisulfide reductase subunit B
MTTYGYFPGCSLGGTSKEYGASTRSVCQALGIELRELDDWSCCGATSGHSTSRDVADALGARNVILAVDAGHKDLIVPCAACYNRTKRAAKAMEEDPARRKRVEAVLGRRLEGSARVRHLLELLASDDAMQVIAERARVSLEGTRIAAYYGCLLLRPPDETGMDDPENPQLMGRLIALSGAEPVDWHFKNECCGASLSIPSPRSVERLVGNIVRNARAAGADCLVTVCPLCQVNLETRQRANGGQAPMPTHYFTQLLGLVLGLSPASLMVPSSSPLLKRVAPAGGVA